MTASEGCVPRVLHVVGAMNMGGAETMLMNLYREVDRAKVQFDFLVFGNDDAVYDAEIRDLGGRILRVSLPGRLGLRGAVASMVDVMVEHGPFLAVHSHVLHASGAVLKAASKAGIGIRIAHSHNTGDRGRGLARSAYRVAARRLIRSNATQLVACGQDAGNYLFGRHWATGGLVLRNSIDVLAFQARQVGAAELVRDELAIHPGTLLMGSVARLEPVKNQPFMLMVLKDMVEAGIDVHLLLVGDGSERESLERKSDALGLSSRVSFLGLRRDVPQLLRAFDVFLMPSLHEGLPLVLVEAQAAGTPALVSTAVTREIDLGLNLLVYRPIDDPADWATVIPEIRKLQASATAISTSLIAHGYDIRESVRTIYPLYGLSA